MNQIFILKFFKNKHLRGEMITKAIKYFSVFFTLSICLLMQNKVFAMTPIPVDKMNEFIESGQYSKWQNQANKMKDNEISRYSNNRENNNTNIDGGGAPPPVHEDADAPLFVAASTNHTLALSYGGTLTAWGDNTYGQCGVDVSQDYLDEENYIEKFADLAQVATGESFSLALDKDGNVWSWGYNGQGQLGKTFPVIVPGPNVNQEYSSTPTMIKSLTKITKIAAGSNHGVALDDDGSVWTWGKNEFGQLGTADREKNCIIPKKIQLPEKAYDIYAGFNCTYIILESGSIYACGSNEYGQMCNDLSVVWDCDSIIDDFKGSSIKKIVCGERHTTVLAENSDGIKEVYAWGDNSKYQLGNSTISNSISPVLVYSSENINDIYGGRFFNVIELNYGEVWYGTGCKYNNPDNNYTENVLSKPTLREINSKIITIGYDGIISFDNNSLQINTNDDFKSILIATLSPDNEIYYSELDNLQCNVKLRFVEFSKQNLSIKDFSTDRSLKNNVADVQYINARECNVTLKQENLLAPWQSPNNKYVLSLNIHFDAVTANKIIHTNGFNVWNFRKDNKRLILDNMGLEDLHEGEEADTVISIHFYPAINLKKFPFYSLEKTNGIDDSWNLGLTVSNLPKGIKIKSATIDETDNNKINIVLDGKSEEDIDFSRLISIDFLTTDIESDISPNVLIRDVDKEKIIDYHTNMYIAPIDDTEKMIISSEKINSGMENKQSITATITGGIFNSVLTASNWSITGLDENVQISKVERLDDTTAKITLSGNSTDRYTDKTVSITCTGDEYSDSREKNDDGSYTLVPLTSENTLTFVKQKRSSGSGGSSIYTITFNTNGGNSISKQTVNRNATVKEPTQPQKDGYNFIGWFTDKELTKEFDFTTKITNSMTLYAKWSEEKIDDSKNQIILTIGKKEVSVFGEQKTNDVAPKIVNDRTMLPARFVAESLGAKVDWDAAAPGIVTITKDDIKIVIYIGEENAIVNGKTVKLDSPAFIENDRTYTPIRFISENLGAKVDWNKVTHEITIKRW